MPICLSTLFGHFRGPLPSLVLPSYNLGSLYPLGPVLGYFGPVSRSYEALDHVFGGYVVGLFLATSLNMS